jgi:hypothetical protein
MCTVVRYSDGIECVSNVGGVDMHAPHHAYTSDEHSRVDNMVWHQHRQSSDAHSNHVANVVY